MISAINDPATEIIRFLVALLKSTNTTAETIKDEDGYWKFSDHIFSVSHCCDASGNLEIPSLGLKSWAYCSADPP